MNCFVLFLYCFFVYCDSLGKMYLYNLIGIAKHFSASLYTLFSKSTFKDYFTYSNYVITIFGLVCAFLAFTGFKHKKTFLSFIISIFVVTLFKYLNTIKPNFIPKCLVYDENFIDLFYKRDKLICITLILGLMISILNVLIIFRYVGLLCVSIFISYITLNSISGEISLIIKIGIFLGTFVILLILLSLMERLFNSILCIFSSYYGSLYILSIISPLFLDHFFKSDYGCFIFLEYLASLESSLKDKPISFYNKSWHALSLSAIVLQGYFFTSQKK